MPAVDWARLVTDMEGFTTFGGVGLIAAAVLLVAARLLLPPEERTHLRFPLIALVAHIGVLGFRALVPESSGAREGAGLLALLLLLVSLGRTGFLVMVHSVLSRRVTRPMPKIFRDILQGAIYAAVLLVVLRAAGVEMGSLLTTSALLTAVIGLSLQDTLGNLFSGLAIQAQRPFEVGDWIQYDDNPDNIAMVVEINWRAAKLLTIQQVEITVPNGMLAKAAIHNFTKPMVEARRSVQAHAPYHIPLRRVQSALLEAVKGVDGVLHRPEPSVIPAGFDERGVQYDVRYFIRDFQRRDVIAGNVRDRVWYALARAAIEIPVPQRTIQLLDSSSLAVEKDRQKELDARERYLRGVDFLKELPDGAIHTLAESSEGRLYDEDEDIIHQGEDGEELFILRRGEVAVLVSGNGGGEAVEVARLSPGHFFGEMSLMTGERRRATVRARVESEVLVLGKEAFSRVFEEYPDLVQHVSDVLAEREEQLTRAQGRSSRPPSQHGDERRAVLMSRIRDFFSL